MEPKIIKKDIQDDKIFNSQKKVLVLSILCMVVLLISSSYAIMTNFSQKEDAITFTTGNLEMTILNGEETFSLINLNNKLPESDQSGLSNATVIPITLKNTGTMLIGTYEVKLVSNANTVSTLNDDYIRFSVSEDNVIYSNVNTLTTNNNIIYSGTNLEVGATNVIYLKMWITDNALENGYDKTYYGSLEIDLKQQTKIIPPSIIDVRDAGNGKITFTVVENSKPLSAYCVNQEAEDITSCTWYNAVVGEQTTDVVATENGNYYVHVKDEEGNIGHSSVVSIIYDETGPSITVSIASSSLGTNNWYRAISIKGIATDDKSTISSISSCITTGSSCTPNSSASSSTKTVAISTSNSTAQKVCFQATDSLGNKSEIICSSAYTVDVDVPLVKSVSYVGSGKVTFTATDIHSGPREYCVNKSASSTSDCSWHSAVSGVQTSDALLSESGTYYVHVKDLAGNIGHSSSVAATITYNLLDYIASTGTQYINTEYYWQNENIEIYYDGIVTKNASSQSLFGNEEYTASSGYTRNFAGIPYGSNGSYSIYLGSGALVSISTSIGVRFTLNIKTTADKKLEIYKDGALVRSTTYSGSVKTRETAYVTTSTRNYVGTIFIFANHNSSRGSSNAASQIISGMKLYRFKLTDNNVLKRDYIPVERISDGVVGLYDQVEKKFYTNAGSGTFTKGTKVGVL